ncbi:F0F1 ATP synthase subunit gamma [Magnetospira sp. QH-2]|uniref:F0F1 ATP synthase subunit gamma n=1 Tax=Magnetospira sp. (strain QH-2) TaxID=1288970 RepID=UPI0003E80BD9|nr:F0F1 ATP synthase subunit gamma [Magnetospira sp. QH-2]CCQ72367.1 ATP synthase subunit gamma, membrane-bound, F1 sector [Magnetospira sp. QH-2]
MANLKDLRIRIASVKSTKKITSAMKMVAASKLRRAQTQAEEARPYATRMERMLGSLAHSTAGMDGAPKLLAGTGNDNVHMLVAFTSDRGLCGGFNSSIVREVRRRVLELEGEGKEVKLMCVGRKASDALRREFGRLIVGEVTGIASKKGIPFTEAQQVSQNLRDMYERGEFDICTIYYNRFKSAISQVVTPQQIIPFPVPEKEVVDTSDGPKAVYIYEPEEEQILAALLPRNLSVQVYRAMLENNASEQGARMTAMDNATRNAGDMIDSLTMTYNRTRQAVITSELIEIISGAEAL